MPPFDLLQPAPYNASAPYGSYAYEQQQRRHRAGLFSDLLDRFMAWRQSNLDASLQTPSMMALGMTAPVGRLPMDTASRMARAKGMGFDTGAFKGAYPYNIRGNASGADELTHFQAMSHPPGQLETYAGNRGQFSGFFSDEPGVANRFAPPNEGAVYPVKLKFSNPLVIDAKKKHAAAYQFEQIAKERGTVREFNRVREALNGGEFDGVILKNTLDEGTVYVPKKPQQVRSVHAAFDPAKSNSPDLLAGVFPFLGPPER